LNNDLCGFFSVSLQSSFRPQGEISFWTAEHRLTFICLWHETPNIEVLFSPPFHHSHQRRTGVNRRSIFDICSAPTELVFLFLLLLQRFRSYGTPFLVIGLKGYLPQSGKIIRYIRVNPMIKKVFDENKNISGFIVAKFFDVSVKKTVGRIIFMR
jgi:hypothetical protein